MDNKEIIGKAMEEVLDEEFAEYIDTLPSCEDHEFSERHNRKMSKLIKRQRKPYFKVISTAGRRAACAVIAVVVFSASALSVGASRKGVFDFMIDRQPYHSGVITAEGDPDADYPDTIEEEYYIPEVPKGFRLKNYDKTEQSVRYGYLREDWSLSFIQYTKSRFEIEYYNFYDYIYSDDVNYLVLTGREDKRSGVELSIYIWNNGRYVFLVMSNLDKDTILDLCKSIKVKE